MPAKFSIFAVAAMPLIPIALACGDDGGGKIKVPDAKVFNDAPPDAPTLCTAESSYPTPSFGSNQFATNYPASGSGSSAQPHVISYGGALNADIDALRLILFQGYGGFGSGDIRPGTYTITGADTKFSTCGICVLVQTNNMGQTFADWYAATSGTVTLTSTGTNGTGTFSGSLSNVSLVHVGKDAMGLPADTTASNCTSTIPTANFTATLMAGSATGKPSDPLALRRRYY